MVILAITPLLGILFYLLWGRLSPEQNSLPAQIPSPSPSPALRISSNTKPGNCLILEEKYCGGVKLIKNPNNPKGLLAAYNVPKGTILFAPSDGYFSDTSSFSFKTASGKPLAYEGVTINTSKDTKINTTNTIFSFVYFKDINNSYLLTIKKGEIIGKVSDKKIDVFGNYNLIFTITRQQFLKENIVSETDVNQLTKMVNKQ